MIDLDKSKRQTTNQQKPKFTHWQKLRHRVFLDQNWMCADCGQAKATDLHHLRYTPLDPDRYVPVPSRWQLKAMEARRLDAARQGKHPKMEDVYILYTWETEDDVVGLCNDCHHGRHHIYGHFYADPEDAA